MFSSCLTLWVLSISNQQLCIVWKHHRQECDCLHLILHHEFFLILAHVSFFVLCEAFLCDGKRRQDLILSLPLCSFKGAFCQILLFTSWLRVQIDTALKHEASEPAGCSFITRNKTEHKTSYSTNDLWPSVNQLQMLTKHLIYVSKNMTLSCSLQKIHRLFVRWIIKFNRN